MELEIIRSLLDYNHWVNDLLLAVVDQVPPEKLREPLGGSSYDTIFGTTAHILQGEIHYYTRWVGEDLPRTGRPSELQTLSELRPRWLEHRRRIDQFASTVTPEALAAPVRYRSRQGTYELPLWQLMLQMVNHGTHHRAELADLLTRVGCAPPPTDLIRYYEERAGQAADPERTAG